jgi:uncharacterized protein (UPF0262 family)
MGNRSHRRIQVIGMIHPFRKILETFICGCGTYYSALPSRAIKKNIE